MRRPDVLVLGGGPAGAAAALALARAGASVAVASRTRTDRPRIGETVPPAVVRPLVELGVWDAFLADGHTPAPGTVACWGGDEPYENEFILDPYGDGWHLDRTRFDALLVGAAAAAGARVLDLPRGARVEPCDRGWSVRTAHGVLQAPFVVDATGRAARFARGQGVARHREDRQVGLVRFGQASRTEQRTLLEACPAGWWYAAVLPGGRAVTAFFTDGDLLPVPAAREGSWERALARTRLVGEVMAPAGASRISCVAAHVGTLARCAGPGWLAVGDAARTLDPLSGQGLVTALTSALRAAEVVRAGCPPSALAAFARETAAAHRAHLSTRLAHCRRERRWPHSPFWQRRHRPLQPST